MAGTARDEQTTTDRERQPTLHRSIGRTVLLLFVVGDILGAGIYALTGTVAGEVGGAIWLPFLAAFVLAALTATAYAELVARYPQAAGAALYANRAFRRPFLTFLVAFAVMMSGITSASAAARAFGGDYLAELLPFGVPTLVAAWVFLGIITLVNVLGVSESIRVNVLLTIIEAGGLLVIIGIGISALVRGEGDPGRALELETAGPAWMGVLGGTALAFYALLGFEDSVNLAEEARHPRSDYPRALFGGLLVAGVIYLAVAFTATTLVETDVLAGSTGPLLEVVRVAGLVFPPWLFALIALLAVANTALINMMMASRLVYGMSREGIVPPVLGRVHARRRTRLHRRARADPDRHRRPVRAGGHDRAAPAAGVRRGERRGAGAPSPRR
jgi:amino acid transporter